MPLWEYCEVAYTPKQVIVHVYSSREGGTYEPTGCATSFTSSVS